MTDTKQAMSIPAAIIVAGLLIACAVYFSRVAPAPTLTQEATPTPSLDFPAITSEDHIRGPENAKVTILEYSDLECPYCKIFHESMRQLIEEYPNDVRWVYRHAPIEQLHAQAPAEANAAECAAAQGKFWEFIDIVFAATPSNDGLKLEDIPTYAQQAGVANIQAFESCVASNQFDAKISQQLEDAATAVAPRPLGTPFNVLITQDGQKTPLGGGISYSQLKSIVEPLL